jgi:RNA polymerase-binding transcription factor DksA
MSQLLSDEQYKQIVDRLLLTEDELKDALDELDLGYLETHKVEMELNQGSFGYCCNCGTWKYEVFDDWCEECRNDMEF